MEASKGEDGRIEEGRGENRGRGLPSVPQFQTYHYTTGPT